jgi:predicted transcriptional regulator
MTNSARILMTGLTSAIALFTPAGVRPAGCLPPMVSKPYSCRMEVQVSAETAKKLNDLASSSGRAPNEIVEDALAGYLEEVTAVRKMLDGRYDELKSGRVKPIDGEEAFRLLREKSERRRSGG